MNDTTPPAVVIPLEPSYPLPDDDRVATPLLNTYVVLHPLVAAYIADAEAADLENGTQDAGQSS